jgi:hypothetical protein
MSKVKMPKGLSIVNLGNRIVAQLYDTVIADLNLTDKTGTLNAGNWFTAHTKKCINLILSANGFNGRVVQDDGVWYVHAGSSLNQFENGKTVQF